MKKIVLTWAAAFALTAVQAQDKLTKTVTSTDESAETVTTHFIYDACGNKVYALVEGVADTTFSYNDFNQLARIQYRALSAPNGYRAIEYTYNDLGQVATETEFIGTRNNGTTTYTYDAHGQVISMVNSRGGMPIQSQNTYDAAGHLILHEIMNPMNPSIVLSATEYIYEDDILVRMSVSSQGIVSSTTAFTYNASGVLTQTSTYNVQTAVTTTTLFSYSDIDASFVPQDVQAVTNPGNTVTLSWTGSATGVIYDGTILWLRDGQDATGITTDVLLDGTYTFYVINNGNAAIVPEVTVFDDTKVGVSNVQLNGELTYGYVEQTNYYGEVQVVRSYNIPISWELPAGSQPQSYIIYYNSTYRVLVEDGSLREYVIPATSVTAWSMATGEYTLPFEIRVIAVYATGQAEPANVVTFTQEESEKIIADHVADIPSRSAAAAEAYTLDGLRLNAVPRKGTYLLRQGDRVRKIHVK